MQARLPEFCDLFQLADRHAVVSGQWPIAKLPRLVTMLGSDKGIVEAEFNFGKLGKTAYVKGRVSAEVELTCQRCVELMEYTLESEFALGLIDNEALVDRLPEEFEALLTEGRHFLPDVIEDELILAVPFVPAHDNSCSSYMIDQKEEQKLQQVVEEEKKPNPFAALKDLM